MNVDVNGEDMDIKVKKITDENGDVKYALPIVVEGETRVGEDGKTCEYDNEFDIEIENPEEIGRIEFEEANPDSTDPKAYIGGKELTE